MRTVVVHAGQTARKQALWVWSLLAAPPPGVETVWVTEPRPDGRVLDIDLNDVQLGPVEFTYQVRESQVTP